MDDVYKQVSEKLNIPLKDVKTIYSLYWKGIKDYIDNLPLEQYLKEDTLENLKCNISITNLGKFSFDFNKFKKDNLDVKYKEDKGQV